MRVPRAAWLGAALAAVTLLRLPAAWSSGNALNHVSGAWMALADDLRHGTLYRPLHDPELGYGGTRFFPLAFSLHAALLAAGLPLLAAGELLSLAAGVLAALGAARFLRRAGHGPPGATGLAARAAGPAPLAAAGLASLVMAGFAGQHALAAVRGDLLAAALALWGLDALLPGAAPVQRPPAAARRPAAALDLPRVARAAAWFALAFAARPTALAAALAGGVHLLLRRERRAALALVGLVAAGAAAVVLATDLLSGGRFLAQLGALGPGGAGPRDLVRAPLRLATLLWREDRPGLALIAAAGLAAAFTVRAHGLRASLAGASGLALLWVAAAGAAALVALASPGTGVNHLLDLEAAAGLLAATSAAAPLRAARAAAPIAALAGLAAAAGLWHRDLTESRLGALRGAMTAASAGAPAPLLSEDPLLPLCAGERPYAADTWMLRLAAARDPALAAPLLADLRSGAFRAVVLLHDPRAPDAAAWFSGDLGNAALAEIRRGWRETFVAEPYRVYRYGAEDESRRTR